MFGEMSGPQVLSWFIGALIATAIVSFGLFLGLQRYLADDPVEIGNFWGGPPSMGACGRVAEL